MKIKYYPLNLVDKTARGGNSGESHLLSAEGARRFSPNLSGKRIEVNTQSFLCVFSGVAD